MITGSSPTKLAMPAQDDAAMALCELERRVYAALETYSNVHRGDGPFSAATTALYERARNAVLDHFGLDEDLYCVIFCSPTGARALTETLETGRYRELSSLSLGLPLGVRALAVDRRSLPRGAPPRTGGGTAHMVSSDSVVWDGAPERFEAGTPAIVNVIATACALELTRRLGRSAFQVSEQTKCQRHPSAADILYHDSFSAYTGHDLLKMMWASVIGRQVQVPVAQGTRTYINLDHAASTPTLQPVWECVRHVWASPQETHREIVAEVRAICSEFLGAPTERYGIVFTSNTTEAIALAAAGIRDEASVEITPVVVGTWLEHNSNELPWRHTPGLSLIRANVDEEGFIVLTELEALLHEFNVEQRHGSQRVVLVTFSGASNVLGTLNDIRAIAQVAHRYGARVLVDAAQLVAHRRIEMAQWDVDYLVFSAHKVYAPFGSGALVFRKPGRFWERLQTADDENVVGIAAMGKAMNLLGRIGMDVIEAEERRLTARLLQGLSSIPGVRVCGVRDLDTGRFQRRAGVVAFNLDGVPHNVVSRELAEHGAIGVRSGCHCAHLLVKRLLEIPPGRPRLADMIHQAFPRLINSLLPGVVRLSLGIATDNDDVEHLLEVLKRVAGTPRSRFERWAASHRGGTPFRPRTNVDERVSGMIDALVERVYRASPAETPGKTG